MNLLAMTEFESIFHYTNLHLMKYALVIHMVSESYSSTRTQEHKLLAPNVFESIAEVFVHDKFHAKKIVKKGGSVKWVRQLFSSAFFPEDF